MGKFQVLTEADVRVGKKLRLWIMSSPKAGKTTSVLTTCPTPAFVLNCDPLLETALAGARRHGAQFDWAPCLTETDFSKAMRYLRDRDYATVVADSFNLLIETMEIEYLDDVNGDGRRAYPALQRQVRWMVDQLFDMPGHLIVNTHWVANGTEGEGIAPMLPGKLKESLPARFNDVVFLKVVKKGGVRKRVFVCAPEGAWGEGSRSLDAEEIDADIGLFIELASKSIKPRKKSREVLEEFDDAVKKGSRGSRRDDYEDDDRPRRRK